MVETPPLGESCPRRMGKVFVVEARGPVGLERRIELSSSRQSNGLRRIRQPMQATSEILNGQVRGLGHLARERLHSPF